MTINAMDVTDEMLKRLRAGLEGVTPGPFEFDGNCGGYITQAGDKIARAYAAVDAAHFANCSPDNIRTLLDTIDGLRARLAEVEGENERLTKADTEWGRLHQRVIEDRAAEIRARESSEKTVRELREGLEPFGKLDNSEYDDVAGDADLRRARSLTERRDG